MQAIGEIVLVQVQRSPLKVRTDTTVTYTTTPLLTVDSLRLTPAGIVGLTIDGGQIVDVHHEQHPQSRNRGQINAISFGFSSHYQLMRERFGSHMSDGCAGENIVIASERIFRLEDLGRRVVIRSAATGAETVLTSLRVAKPCVEFSYFALNQAPPLPAAEIKSTLQFLDRGTRGFYAVVETKGAGYGAIVEPGDKVFLT